MSPGKVKTFEGTCAMCRYFKDEQGLCLRHPPQLIFFATPEQGPDGTFRVQANVHSAFPAVDPESWCGEFIPLGLGAFKQ